MGTRWKGRGAYLHDDNNTVTLPYQRNSKNVGFLTMRLSDDLKKVSSKKKVYSTTHKSDDYHIIVLDKEKSCWRWFYGEQENYQFKDSSI